MAVVKACSCPSEYQDKKYGKGARVHNETAKDELRCTVCGTVKK